MPNLSNNTFDNTEHSASILSLELILYLTLMTATLLFAVASNGLVIYCVVRLRKLRTVTNIFICNLSVSDIILAGFVMPQRLHDITHSSEDFYEGIVLCKVVNFSPLLVITSSVYTLVFISFERRQEIINTQRNSNKFTTRNVVAAIIFIWMFGIGVSFPTLLEYTVYEKQVTDGNLSRTIQTCGSTFPLQYSLSNAIFVLTVSYLVPVVLLTKNYTQIATFVWKRGNWMRDKSEISKRDATKARMVTHKQNVVKLLIMVAAVFAVSWLPFYGILIDAKASGKDASENAGGVINLSLLALATFSTAYNVVLYVIFNPSFRRAILGVLRCTKTSVLDKHVVDTERSQQTPASMPEGESVIEKAIADSSYTVSAIVSKSEISLKEVCTN